MKSRCAVRIDMFRLHISLFNIKIKNQYAFRAKKLHFVPHLLTIEI